MFDNIKFIVSDSDGDRKTLELTALSLLSYLCYVKLVNRENAYDICNFLACAEPRQEYNVGTFRIIALDY